MEKFKFTLLIRTVGNGDVSNFTETSFDVEEHSHFLSDAFRQAIVLLGSDVLSGVSDYTVSVALHSCYLGCWFVLCNGFRPGTFEWCCSAEIPAIVAEHDADVSEQADCDDCDQEQYEDVSEINAGDMAEEIAEECEDASEADLAHLFGYDLPSTDFCDYGDNGFYIV